MIIKHPRLIIKQQGTITNYRYVEDVSCLYNYHCLDTFMIIWSAINCPTVICLPTVCYFYERDVACENMAPGSILIVLQKQKIPCCNLFYLAFDPSIFTTLSRLFAHLGAPLPERDWQPLLHVVLRVLVICVQVLFTLCCLVLLLVR